MCIRDRCVCVCVCVTRSADNCLNCLMLTVGKRFPKLTLARPSFQMLTLKQFDCLVSTLGSVFILEKCSLTTVDRFQQYASGASQRKLVSWCFEPSHPQRITSGLCQHSLQCTNGRCSSAASLKKKKKKNQRKRNV